MYMEAKYEDERVLIQRFCQVMAETIGVNKEIRRNIEYGIFPYGYQGEIADRLLQHKFGIKPQYIIDNKWAKFNPDIISLEELKKITFDDYYYDHNLSTNDNYIFIRDAIKQYKKL